MPTLSQFEQKKEKRKSTPAMIGEGIGKRLASVRVNYTIVVVVVCWSAFALFIYFLRLLEFN